MHSRSAGSLQHSRCYHDLPDELVLLVDVDRKFVAEVALSMFIGPGRFNVFLPALGRLPISGHSVLVDDLFFLAPDFLLRGWHQGGVNHLTTPGNKAFLQNLLGDRLEQRNCPSLPNPVFKGPKDRTIRKVERLGQAAEPLVAQSIQKKELHPFIGVVVESLQDQNPNHDLGWIGRAGALWVRYTRSHPINLCSQGREVDARLNLSRRITQMIDLLGPLVWGKQFVFDRALKGTSLGFFIVSIQILRNWLQFNRITPKRWVFRGAR